MDSEREKKKYINEDVWNINVGLYGGERKKYQLK
jgi:hypothetical protein